MICYRNIDVCTLSDRYRYSHGEMRRKKIKQHSDKETCPIGVARIRVYSYRPELFKKDRGETQPMGKKKNGRSRRRLKELPPVLPRYDSEIRLRTCWNYAAVVATESS